MISEIQTIGGRNNGAKGTSRPAESVRTLDWNVAMAMLRRFSADPPTQRVSDWVSENIVFNEPEVKGTFDFTGRNYIRQWLDDNNDASVCEQTIVSATGMGKTVSYLAGVGYKIVNRQPRVLWVMPATNGANGVRNMNKSRLLPMCESSPIIADKMPVGAARFNVSSLHIRMAGSVIDFAGANSPSQIAGNRCSDIRLDEVDKFKREFSSREEGGQLTVREAGAAYIARTRADGVIGAQIFNASTPTNQDGPIWKSLMASNLNRRFLPCPRCNQKLKTRISRISTDLKGWFVLIWSEQFCVLPPKFWDGRVIPVACVRWDKEARRKDETWDMDRVVRSARAECPHCGGHIVDSDMGWMDANGVWLATQRDGEANRHQGYHLPAMYGPRRGFESSFGGLARQFLTAKDSSDGMRGFINSVLAEVDVAQEHTSQGAISIGTSQPGMGSVLRVPMMSVDRQSKYPGFWYVVRSWVVSVLRPARTMEEQVEFEKKMTADQKTICEKLTGEARIGAEQKTKKKDDNLYSASAILSHMQRTNYWPRLAEWLLGNGLVEKRLTEFFQVEFATDLIRLLEFICKQPEVNIRLGRQGDSRALEAGSADSWEELDEAQRRHSVANGDVIVDARFGQTDNAEVYAECFRRCPPGGFCFYAPVFTGLAGGHFSAAPRPGSKPFALGGWQPCVGFPEHKVWANREKIRLPYGQVINDPFSGKMEARQFFQYSFQFDAQWALSELARVRKRHEWCLAHDVKFVGFNSAMRPVDLAEYNLHLKGYYWDDRKLRWEAPGKGGGGQSRSHPNHLYDCEKNMVARAVWKGIFRYEKLASVGQTTQNGGTQ